MGKPRTLKSSMKAIQEALASLKPVAPICMQQSRTDSFRDLYTSFNSIYYTPPSCSSASTTSSSSTTVIPCSSAHVSSVHTPHCPRADPTPPAFLFEDDCCATSTSCFSSSSSSSALPAAMECDNEANPLVPVGVISSTRFFFSPRTTKSILEDAALDAGTRKIKSLSDQHEVEEEEGDDGDSPSTSSAPASKSLSSSSSSFCRDSVELVMSSHDPYRDFRVSMEEMVEAHGLREWSVLQELLQCYLRLNDRKTHKIIMLAFVDLLMHLISPDNRPSSPSTFISISSPPPLF